MALALLAEQPPAQVDEDALAVERYRGGDARAFDGLVRKYQRPIYYLALRYVKDPDDAKDVAQRAFVRAHGDLYEKNDGHPARLKAPGGRIALGSLAAPGFAVGAEMDFRSMMPRTSEVTVGVTT